MDKALFVAAFFFAYTVQAITGFAGNLFAMPVGTTLLGLTSSVAILNTMGFLACGSLALINYKHIHWRELAKMVSVMLPFVLIGIWLDTLLPLSALLKVYGALIVVVGLRGLLAKKQRFLPEWALWIVIGLAGLIQGMFVSGGALLVIYAIQKITDKQQFRATLSAVWMVLNFLYACIAFGQGSFTSSVFDVIVWCIPAAIVATLLGQRLQKHLSQERFLKCTYVILLGIGLVLLVTSS
ncbi:sulfite exporter TauE/SafE family protein [Adlercreutzia agrestimuris]|uniref:sulfite exporter TauE/SafE family protein n=1 Tax=Adlercreutzia agrestimuris TaxID=2941324 RepID=UPI00203DAF77|nr:sulfite exporter TauE/SafE family protein [Adlercreutzia agrestimuris]